MIQPDGRATKVIFCDGHNMNCEIPVKLICVPRLAGDVILIMQFDGSDAALGADIA